MKTIKFLVLVGLVALFSTHSLYAQATTAAIVGTVTDNTGAVVPAVTVTATQVDTNFTRSVETGSDGKYLIPLLPVGTTKLKYRPRASRNSNKPASFWSLTVLLVSMASSKWEP